MDPLEKRRRCREYASKFIDIQREEFRRLGVFGDWRRSRTCTMAPAYQATIAREFGRFVGPRPGLQGPKAGALVHALQDRAGRGRGGVRGPDHAVGLREVPAQGAPRRRWPPLGGRPVSLVIWTTTPWTLPANLAIAVHPELRPTPRSSWTAQVLIVAQPLEEAFLARCPASKGRGTALPLAVPGRALEGLRWPGTRGSTATRRWSLGGLRGDGGGHRASCTPRPATARRTTRSAVAHGLEIYNPVDDGGRFIAEVAHFAGQHGLRREPEDHRAPARRSGRCVGRRVVTAHVSRTAGAARTRSSSAPPSSGSSRMDQRRAAPEGARRDPNEVRWIPGWGEERIYSMVANRPDWCISRQRVWGVPIAAFYCTGCERRCCSTRRWSSTWPRSCARARGADELVRAGGGRAAARRHPLPEVRRGRVRQGDRHPRRVVRLRLSATRRCCEQRAEAALAGRHVPRGLATSIAAGSTPRCWTRVGTRGRAALPLRAHPRLRGGRRRAARCRSRAATTSSPEELIPKYGAEVLRLWVAAEDYSRGHPHLARDPEPARRRLPAHPQHLPLPARQPGRLRPRARPALVRRRWTSSTTGRSCAWATSSRGCARRTTTTSSTWPSTRSTTSARSISRALPRHHQGPALHLGARRPAPARVADGVLRAAHRA